MNASMTSSNITGKTINLLHQYENYSKIMLDDNSSLIGYTEVYDVITDNVTHSYYPIHRSYKSFLEYKVAMALVVYILPMILLLGTIGNVLALIVLLTKRMRTTSVNFYLAILAIADTGALYLSGFKTWFRVITGFELLHTSNAGCKIVMFLFLLSLHMSAWLVVAVSMDRWVAVWFPFKSLTFCNVQRARWVTSLGCAILSIYNSHVFWTMYLQVYPSGAFSCRPSKHNIFMTKAYPWVKLTTYSCIPFTIVLILNICIIIKIIPEFGNTNNNKGIKGNKTQNKYLNTDCRATPRNLKDRRVTLMLLGVSISWLCLTAPFTLWSLIASPSADPQSRAAAFLAKTVCFLLMYINNAANFYLYCLTGKKFRQAMRDFIFWRCIRREVYIDNSLRTLRSRGSSGGRSQITVNSKLTQQEEKTLRNQRPLNRKI